MFMSFFSSIQSGHVDWFNLPNSHFLVCQCSQDDDLPKIEGNESSDNQAGPVDELQNV